MHRMQYLQTNCKFILNYLLYEIKIVTHIFSNERWRFENKLHVSRSWLPVAKISCDPRIQENFLTSISIWQTALPNFKCKLCDNLSWMMKVVLITFFSIDFFYEQYSKYRILIRSTIKMKCPDIFKFHFTMT